MSANKTDPASDFEALSRQYWNAFSQFAQPPGANLGQVPGFNVPGFQMPSAQGPGFQDGLAWWSKLAGQGRGDVDSAIERMNAQAGSWFGAMQQLAAGFAGRDAGPEEVGKAWSAMLGGAAGNPVADMFKRMSGADAHGVEGWMAQAAPFLGALRGETSALLSQPAFGLGREQQERLQGLAQAQVAYLERSNDYSAQLARAGKLAFERFERKLTERSEPGRQIDSARALFDLWIDAAEEAWSEVALTPEYCRVYGELVNAQMRLRAGVQREVELAAGLLGLPTRSEVNASHRKLAALEREVRALKAQLTAATTAAARKPAPDVTAPPRTSPPKATRDESAPPRKTRPKAPPPPRVPSKPRRTAVRATKPVARKSVLPQVVAPRAVVRASPKRKSSATRSVGDKRKKAR